MPDHVERLVPTDQAAIAQLLQQDPVINLFLLGFLATHPVDRGWWYGIRDDAAVTAVVLVLPGRLAVPWCPDDHDAARLGDELYHLHRPSLLVGPRSTCDALWRRWTRGRAASLAYDQRLYFLEDPPPGQDPPGFRRALETEWPTIARYAAAMENEDLGIDRATENPRLHDQVVHERVKAGRTWVIEREGRVVFQVNVGTTHRAGCQIGGTYVPPALRGRGYASVGVAALCRRLLALHPRVTLHVNEANASAVRVYDKCGFVRGAPFRLITPEVPMLHANDRFSDAVARKVSELEQQTDAEVVVVAAERSGSYRDVALSLAALAALSMFGVLVALPWPVHPALAVADLVGVWAVVGWLVAGHRISSSLAGETRRRAQVRTAAAAEFHLEAVHATPRRTGLLVYVSAWEHHVELIPDVGLEARIPRGRWAEATAQLSTTDLDRFLAGLDAVGKILAEHVPATGEGTAELSDAPRIRA